MSERSELSSRQRERKIGRRQGNVIGGIVVAIAIWGGNALLSKSAERTAQQEAKIAQIQRNRASEERANARINHLTEKYSIKGLSKEAQEAFTRLVQLHYGDMDSLYLPLIDAGRGVQDDIIIISKALRARAEDQRKPIDEMALAEDIIPQSTQEMMIRQGFVLTPTERASCTDYELSYGQCDNTNSAIGNFAVRYSSNARERIVIVPLVVEAPPN